MAQIYSTLMTIISFVVIFGVIVFVHELGHFMFAKWHNIRVEEFAMGMGKRLLSFQKGETTYALNLFPIGGYVRMEGEDQSSNDPRAFSNAKPFVQFQVLIAGAAMNFILGWLALTVLFFNQGIPVNVVGSTIPDFPAAKAGLLKGDVLEEINGAKTKDWNSVTTAIKSSTDSVDIKILRKHEPMVIKMKIAVDPASNKKVIGIMPAYEKHIGGAAVYATKQFGEISTAILDFFKQIPQKGVDGNDVAGPLGMAKIVGEAAEAGINPLLGLTALFSINLGIFNLLPFPALDGGRLIFVIIELITGKRPSKEKEGFVHGIGMMILLALMVLVLFNDFNRILFK